MRNREHLGSFFHDYAKIGYVLKDPAVGHLEMPPPQEDKMPEAQSNTFDGAAETHRRTPRT